MLSGWRSTNDDDEPDSDESFASCAEDSQVSYPDNGHNTQRMLSGNLQ